MAKKGNKNQEQKPPIPVVSVLGHVDHGKTTLLDAIRKTSVAEREHGGITQKIGASEVEIIHEGKKRSITFIDTPGHEAFSQMRSRGAQAADIVLLIVSCVDGVMPQTIESIQLLKATKTPFIVVLTKADSPEKNVEKARGQLLKNEVLLEGSGGDVPIIEISAKEGKNIKELLDLILLLFDTSVKKDDLGKFLGIIIESKLDQKAGPKATIIVKSGKLSVKDEIVCGNTAGRVRNITKSSGIQTNIVGMGEGAEMLGFDKVPDVGSMVYHKGQQDLGEVKKDKEPALSSYEKILSILIVADTQGSLEAIVSSIPREKIDVVMTKTGEVTPSDVLFAKSTGSIILGFNTKIRPDVEKLVITEKVLARNYNIIYEMLSEIEDVLEGKEISMQEQILGEAKVLARFPFEKTEVLGIGVVSGRIAKGDRIRIVRDEEALGETAITSSRQGKEQVSKIEAGNEGGIIISPFIDFEIGDMIISHR